MLPPSKKIIKVRLTHGVSEQINKNKMNTYLE